MNLPFLRPKWRHPDPQVRRQAVARLEDEEVLAQLAAGDPEPDIRRAALQRVNDPARLAALAKSGTDVNFAALERLADQPSIIEVARQATSPEVRALAVVRIEDKRTIERIGHEDTSPLVRRQARAKLAGPNSLRQFLRRELGTMEIARGAAAEGAEICGDLDTVCDLLASDRRFRIHGMIGHVEKPATTDSAAPAAAAAPRASLQTVVSGATVLELLGNRNVDDATMGVDRNLGLQYYYRIEIRRTGENAFGLRVYQRESRAPFFAATGGASQ